MKSYLLFDLDGTCRPLPMGGTPGAPPPKLGGMLKAVRQGGYLLAAATGSSVRSVRRLESSLKLRFDDAAASYGTRHIRRGGYTPSERILIPPEEHRALGELTPELDRIRSMYGGHLDDHLCCYTMFFPPNSIAWKQASGEVQVVLAQAGHQLLTLRSNEDGGVCVMPRSASKELLVDYLSHGLGRKILVGAGDTASDASILEAAEFPIVTRSALGAPVDETLAEIIQRRGVGYVAPEGIPHGFGLMRGLMAARELGVINF